MHLLITAMLAVAAFQTPSSPPKVDEVEGCLACHSDRELTMTLPSGEQRSVFVDPSHLSASVHGKNLGCSDCHGDMSELPHRGRPFKTSREYDTAYHEQCKRCHFANYTKTLDSAHQEAVARGDRMAPLCADCHGSHDITSPDKPRARISQTCATCHGGVFEAYNRSVHGRAIRADHSDDVPACTDCHRAHDVAGPQDANWRLQSHEICARCHANQKLMSRYGLSANVGRTYLADFHGATAVLQKGSPAQVSALVAVCSDCHGVHDIAKADDPESPVFRANLVKTCRKCHENASESFPAAWLSHYEPGVSKAPLVYAVKLAYMGFIPFVIGGLLLQMLLHIWRVVVNR